MIYIFLADGFEDMEAVIPFDIFKRAEMSVVTVGVGKTTVKSAHGLSVNAEISEDKVDLKNAEAFVFPGGWPGAKNLKNSKIVNDAITFALYNDIVIAAICASPGYVLSGTGALTNKKYTCFPGFEVSEGEYTAKKLETDGNLITANGPGAAKDFALAVVSKLKGNTDGLEEFLK